MQTAKTTNMRKLTALMLAIAVAAMPMTLSAAIPSGYYSAAEGKSGQALLTALYNIIKNRTTPSYDGLWTSFKTTDVDANNKIIDMYSTCLFTPGTDQCGNYSQVGSCYNREHSFPKSWWGGGTSTSTYPYADLFHLYPTDGYVNNQRGNYPFGECTNGTRLSSSLGTALGRLGTSTFSGYTGTVFEPDDIYKGDFARTYFYIVTCYNGMVSGWSSNTDMLGGTSYPAFTTWAQNLLLSWHRLDAVSDKETTRNDKVYNIQNNRNPFIDYPELVEYIWGNKVGTPWYAGSTTNPVLAQPVSGTTIDFGTIATDTYTTQTITVHGTDLTKALTVSVSGSAFSCTTTSISATNANNGTTITVRYTAPSTTQSSTGTLTISSSEVSTTVNLLGQSVSGIVALAASDVSSSSFQANWTPAGNATSSTTYQLHVYEDDGTTYVSGFPKNVSATSGQYSVYNLDTNTTYYYKLTSSTLTSNVVEVRTLGLNRMLSIQSEHDLEFGIKQGATSNILEAEVYTENITQPVTLSLGGDWGVSKYEISKNQTDWSSTLTIDPSGETFYIRVKDTSKWGSFEGEIIATCGDLEYSTYIIAYIIGQNMPVDCVIEDWESCASGGSSTSPISTTLFNDDFSGFDGASNGTNITNSLNNNMNETGWSGTQVYSYPGCLRLGSRNTGGTLISPTFDLTNYDAISIEVQVSKNSNTNNIALTVELYNNSGTVVSSKSQVLTQVKFDESNFSTATPVYTLELDCSNVTTGSYIKFSVPASAQANFLYFTATATGTETTQGTSLNNYNTKTVQGTSFSWSVSNAGIWSESDNDNDRINGSKVCRLGNTNNNTFIAMTQDKIGGASKVTLMAAPFGSDNTATINVSYSTDQGSTWTQLESITLPKVSVYTAPTNRNIGLKVASGSLTEYTIPVNVKDDVRFKFEKTSGGRVNIDDISIYDHHVSTDIEQVHVNADQRGSWTVWAVDGGLNISSQQKLKFEVYNLDARRVAKTKVQGSRTLSLPAGIYIVTDGQSSRKVIVR